MWSLPGTEVGLLGFIIFTLGGVCGLLYKKIISLYKEKDDLQERRFTGVNDTNDKYVEAMGEFSQTAKLLLAKLDGESRK